VKTIQTIREFNPGTTLETLIPDFAGKMENVQQIVDVAPEIVSHNIETVRRMTKMVRVQAKYDRSLEVLKYLSDHGMKTKSGIMLGMGETEEEILETLDDLRRNGVEILTIGQYMQPSPRHLEVKEYVSPERFANIKKYADHIGFTYVESGPLVRSSYHAEKHI
jgi:lipoic acid synthetase